MNKTKKILSKVITVSLLSTLLLSGCGDSQGKTEGALASEPRLGENAGEITMEEAKQIVSKEANINGNKTNFEEKEYDLENGKHVYELEFTANGISYEYEIDAVTGEILKVEDSSKEEAEEEMDVDLPGDDSDDASDNDGLPDENDTDDDTDHDTDGESEDDPEEDVDADDNPDVDTQDDDTDDNTND